MQDTSRVSQPARTRIVIGNGITALAFVEQCALSRGDTLIVLGERARQLGRGAAYAKGEAGTPWRYAYLLNSPADDIDPVFAGWLQARWPDITQTMTGRAPRWLDAAGPLVAAGDIQGVNAPREFYGDFMEEQAEVAFAALAEAGVTVRIVEDMGISVSRADGRLVVETAASGPLHADSVDIAPGGPSTLRIDGDDGAFAVPAVFGHEHQIAEHIRAGREIVCIGGNAAMLDVLRLCQSLLPEDEIKFTAIAPDGEIPEPLIPRLPRRITKPELGTGHATAESLLDTIEAEISRARAEGDEQREIRAGFRAYFLASSGSDRCRCKGWARK
ncbi:MAG: FAD/NAD(P)-binding protein, partial [Pseudomonadota bacterium]